MNTQPKPRPTRPNPTLLRPKLLSAILLAPLALSSLPALAETAGAAPYWPSLSAPCNTSLQACIDGTASGRIDIVSGGNVGNGLNLGSKSIELVAQNGVRPVVGSGGITGYGQFVTIEGFRIEGGGISLNHAAAEQVRYKIRDNEFIDNAATSSYAIAVQTHFADAYLEIENNRISTGLGSAMTPIAIGLNGGTSNLRILHNRVSSAASAAHGSNSAISLYVDANATASLRLAFNQLRGRHFNGLIEIQEGFSQGSSSTLLAYLHSNLMSCGGRSGAGLSTTVNNGQITLVADSNTIVDCGSATFVSRANNFATGSITSTLSSNLIAFNNTGYDFRSPVDASLTRSKNLVYGNGSNLTPVGPSDLLVDPLLVSVQHPYLRAGSPAIDAADTNAASQQRFDIGLLLDADGLRRIKGSQNDIGAFEYGDRGLRHVTRVQNTNGNSSIIGGLTGADLPLLSPRQDGGSTVDFAYGSWFNTLTSQWNVFTEDGSAMPLNAGFNVFAPASGYGVFVHTASAANTNLSLTRINPSSLAITDPTNHANGFVLASQDWITGGPTNDFPITLGYGPVMTASDDSWYIANSSANNLDAIPDQARFHIYSQDRSPNAFVVDTGLTFNGSTHITLDHPLLNDNPCAQLQVTRLVDQDGSDDAPLKHWDLRYVDQHWTIEMPAGPYIPLGTRFAVLVDPRQVFECSGELFKNSFE